MIFSTSGPARGESPPPFSLTGTLDDRPQTPRNPDANHGWEVRALRAHGSSYYNKVIANFVPQR
jgi:hypothetical protein